MSRYIDADKLICAIDGAESLDTERDYDEIARFIEEAETADVEEVRHGEWLPTGICRACSECDFYVYNTTFEEPAFYHQGYHYCPNCGAKMDGKETK